MIVSVDYRITTTGPAYSDYILPAAQHYEKIGHGMMSVHHLQLGAGRQGHEPLGDALPDMEIGFRLLEKIEERAKARGLKRVQGHAFGNVRSSKVGIDRPAPRRTAQLRDEETRNDELNPRQRGLRYSAQGHHAGDAAREGHGTLRTSWGDGGPRPVSQPSTIRPDEVHNPLRWHTEDKIPYDTLVRRAQYYIDHEWFLEAGEELPTHKEPPPGHGGRNRRFEMTSGHNRWSIHSMNMTNNVILNTHRG